METTSRPYTPFFQKLSLCLLSTVLILILLYLGKGILIPLMFAGIFTIVLIRPCNYLESKRVKRGLSAGIVLLAAIMITAFVIYILSAQIANFKDEMPNLQKQLVNGLNKGELYMKNNLHINHKKLEEYTNKLQSTLLSNSSYVVGATFSTVGTGLFYMILIPIYTFLMLIYRSQVVLFFEKSFAPRYKRHVNAILLRTRYVIQSYVVGLLIELIIVAALICIGLSITGAKYALLLGLLAAILNLIPYLGILTAALLTFLITLATNDIGAALASMIVLWAVHLIDSNILLPKVVGSKVKINALVTIVAVIVGENIWGIPGMFLSIPLIAILKVILDSVEYLKPWGILLGDSTKKHKPLKLTALKKKIPISNEK